MVHSRNEIGKAFYVRQGFSHRPEQDADDEWYMEKTLDLSQSSNLLHNLILFGRILRGLGLDVNPGRMIDLVNALEHVNIGRKADFYYAASTLLVHSFQPVLAEAGRRLGGVAARPDATPAPAQTSADAAAAQSAGGGSAGL
jgi:uncharacterized protein with von Willebrand factor type A (vWA) domain